MKLVVGTSRPVEFFKWGTLVKRHKILCYYSFGGSVPSGGVDEIGRVGDFVPWLPSLYEEKIFTFQQEAMEYEGCSGFGFVGNQYIVVHGRDSDGSPSYGRNVKIDVSNCVTNFSRPPRDRVVLGSWFEVVEWNGICGFREPGSGRIKPLRAALEGDPVLKGLADGGDSVFSFEEDASSGEQFIVVCSGDPEGLFGRRIPVSKG